MQVVAVQPQSEHEPGTQPLKQGSASGYENEPRESFLSLPPHLHSLYYHYERLSADVAAEISFYHSQFAGHCSRLLELGCGTSIISTGLAQRGLDVTGIDLCCEMLRFPRKIPAAGRVVQMDMCRLGLKPCFDGAIIAHNTLNLLADVDAISRCLAELKRVLIPPGIVVFHLHAATPNDMKYCGERRLQFHIFTLPTGETVVKESITRPFPDRHVLYMEQRYKYRNFSRPNLNRNYRQELKLALYRGDAWLALLREAGFTPLTSSSKFSEKQPDSPSTLIVTAEIST